MLSTAAAACPETTFSFQGQPDCVELVYSEGRTLLSNRCEAPMIVDASVLTGTMTGLIGAGTNAELRDLSAFTLGMEGQLYPVFAVMEHCEAPTSVSLGSSSEK
jgi:hypothetical protein